MTFAEEVYRLCMKIPEGKVTTYKEISRTLNTKAYRAVGQALRKNPYAPTVPCHRVIASDFSIGGFQGKVKGNPITKKINLLKKEGVSITQGKVHHKHLYTFKK